MLSNGVLINPTDEFNNYGLRFPIEYLKKIGCNIIFLPLEYMAQYVDTVTKKRVDLDEDFGSFIYKINESDIENMNINATSIGNLAYACLYSKHEKIRQVCEESLNKIFKKYAISYKKSIWKYQA
jgi:hypothetical protein